MSNLNIEEIKELLEEFPFNQDKEIISKFIAGEKLTQREILHAFHMSFPLFSLVILNKRFETNKQTAENEWSRSKIQKLDNVGTVKKLKILPLIDFYAEGNFSTEEYTLRPGLLVLVISFIIELPSWSYFNIILSIPWLLSSIRSKSLI